MPLKKDENNNNSPIKEQIEKSTLNKKSKNIYNQPETPLNDSKITIALPKVYKDRLNKYLKNNGTDVSNLIRTFLYDYMKENNIL
jgi:FtsZ-interacting cell division protein YlmF